MNRFFPNTRSNIFGWSTFKHSALLGLEKAQNASNDLPNKINHEIQRLTNELKVL